MGFAVAQSLSQRTAHSPTLGSLNAYKAQIWHDYRVVAYLFISGPTLVFFSPIMEFPTQLGVGRAEVRFISKICERLNTG